MGGVAVLYGFFLGGVGPTEMLIIMVVAVLLFGKRLPDVGRSLGKGLMEFKKGVRGIEDEINSAVNTATPTPSSNQIPENREEATAPKFEPPPAESTAETLQSGLEKPGG